MAYNCTKVKDKVDDDDIKIANIDNFADINDFDINNMK